MARGKAWSLCVLSGLALLLALQTRAYASVWQSDLTLWAHAAQQAPRKPRPWVNLGSFLVQAGRLEAARAAWTHAQTAAQSRHVPAWDRRTALLLAGRNLDTLASLAPARSSP